jgi:hypothetical protein
VNLAIPILQPAAITPAWLSSVLRAGGVDAEVRDFKSRRIGTGQIGDSIRFDLVYARAPEGAPASLVGKFPSSSEVSRATGIALGNYLREVNFYKHLAASALISTPKCYFTDIDEKGDFVLMMEDLSPAEQGDQLKGCTLGQAKLVLHEAAKLHASHWGDEALEDVAWISQTRAAGGVGSADPKALSNLWQAFLQRYGERLSAGAKRVGEALIAHYGTYDAYYKGPKSLVHIDYRPDNMMFGTAAGGKPLTVLDWQSLALGCGVTDVTYFLAGALPRDNFRAIEKDFVREHYYERLCELGVKNYDFETLWRDYRSRAFALFLVAFYASMIVVQTERGDDMFMAMIHSATDQAMDLDSLSFLK